MKKMLYTAVLLAVAAGCTKEMDYSAPAGGNLVPYTFHAVLEQTKAEIANDGKFSWSAGDEIAVYNQTDNQFYTFTTSAGDGEFTAMVPDGSSFLVAYYPASIAGTAPDQVVLPDTYSQADATEGSLFPMMADATGTDLAFSHLGALLRLTVKDVPVNATSLVLSSDATLTGAFAPAEVGGKQVISAGSAASTVTIDLSNAAKTDLTVTIPVPVGTYGYNVSLSDGSAAILSKDAASRELKRASLHKMAALTVTYPVTEYQVRGRYALSGASVEWGDDSLVPFTAVDGYWGWNKATVEVPDYYVVFKLYKTDGNVYAGTTLGSGRKIVGSLIPIAADNDGNDISIYTNRTALDIYYNPSSSELFSLPAGADFVIPTTQAGEAVDEYALIGYHASDPSWASDFFLEAVYGFDDWRVVRIGTGADGDPHFSFKFRKNGGWEEQVGGIFKYNRKASTLCYAKTSNNSDFDVYPGAAGNYDIYLNKDLKSLFILPEGTPFNVPGRKEQEDLVSILYIVGGLNNQNWDMDFPLTFASSDNHEWYALKNANKISGWGAMVFKLYNGGWGAGRSVGFSWTLNPDNKSFIGDMNTVYPLYLRDGNDDIPNIQLATDGGAVDIYIKADLSEIFTLSAGAPFAVPSSAPAVAPKAVFIGDSITYFWNNADRGNPTFFSSNNYMTKGVEGQTSATIKNRFNYDVITNNPEKVVIQCGANDLAGNGGTYVAPAEICQNIADMASAAETAGIEVLIGSLLPCNYFWWNTSVNPADNIIATNALLKDLCTTKGYTYVNYYDSLVDPSSKGLASAYSLDGCHPTKAGYTVMEGIVQPLLQ